MKVQTETIVKLNAEQATALSAVLKQLENTTTVKIAKPAIKTAAKTTVKKNSIANLTFDASPRVQGRIVNSLERAGIKTIAKLKRCTHTKLMGVKGISDSSIAKIIKVITTL